MPDTLSGRLDATRLLFDLQQANAIAEQFSGCLQPDQIAATVTAELVKRFDCAFARLWLVEPDGASLRLVASAGLYTHVNGSFARVPMGAYKVGKIAQNRVPFLSNQLAEESWVKDRNWALEQNIQGFAGYPLAIQDRVIGVLATFSHHPMASEFLEVLQTLCTTVTVALDTALQHQQQSSSVAPTQNPLYSPLSDLLALVLTTTRLTLVGTERLLTPAVSYIFLQTTERLNQQTCHYCRLTYGAETVVLDAILACPTENLAELQTWSDMVFGDLPFAVAHLGGSFEIDINSQQKVIQVLLMVPYPSCTMNDAVQIRCQSAVLQLAFTHLAHQAQLHVVQVGNPSVPLVTDDVTLLDSARPILWLDKGTVPVPDRAAGCVDLNVQPEQLREAIGAIARGETVGANAGDGNGLSDREREVLNLLAQGHRDRDIAQSLHISESTVKFHLNNTLIKLNARNRYQAVYQATINGWITPASSSSMSVS